MNKLMYSISGLLENGVYVSYGERRDDGTCTILYGETLK